MEQDNHYYPYGMMMGESGDILDMARSGSTTKQSDANPYLYGGKEYLTTAGANLLDFTARTYDPTILMFHTPDPLRDKYLPVHSYLYCGANPINRIDPTGCGDFLIENEVVGWDGKEDGRAYALKTTKDKFNEGDETVNGAGLSKKDAKATIAFIKNNNGNSEAFTDDCIAYTNCIEIEGSASVRQQMVAYVSERDNGKGGTNPENNREHGGEIVAGGIKKVKSGPVCDLRNDTKVYINMSEVDGPTFHSHPSGTLNSSTTAEYKGAGAGVALGSRNGQRTSYVQHPSQPDINNSGYTTNYVIGMRDNKVYIYNRSGVQAVVKASVFIKEYPKPEK